MSTLCKRCSGPNGIYNGLCNSCDIKQQKLQDAQVAHARSVKQAKKCGCRSCRVGSIDTGTSLDAQQKQWSSGH